jgi:hypothetical protein
VPSDGDVSHVAGSNEENDEYTVGVVSCWEVRQNYEEKLEER